MNTTLNQLYEGMAFLYGGCVIGIVSALLDIVRRRIRHGLGQEILDLLLVAVIVVVTALAFLVATGGMLRLFGFIVLLCGYLMTHWAFHPWLGVI